MNDSKPPKRAPKATSEVKPTETAAAGEGAGYRVLARKYRPATFEDLIGQDAMVRTISNAFETGRIPQAWILTGVRGVGKTTTARILARALNYELPDGSVTGPAIKMPKLGVHCQAIMESRHIDVLEMDAASHNGVEDVRQINDAIRYAPVSARYKVYILDEVHMLTGAAFNALLKTLEEPPPHAKFIFATTEIRKVPVTVLSRCQRFDLRRVETELLMTHLQNIAAKEGVAVEREALALITRAAEGSVRDALSLLDQATAHAAGAVRGEDVRSMLGMADRTRMIDLFEALVGGDIARALQELRDQYNAGADPVVALTDLAEFAHFVTRVKIVPSVAGDISLSETERTRGRALATVLSMRVLSRAWQMLLKGVAEVKDAGRPIDAAEMVLVRIAYVADLPTPDEVIRSLDHGTTQVRPPGTAGTASASAMSTSPKPAAGFPSKPGSGSTTSSAARHDPPRGAQSTNLAPAARPYSEPAMRAEVAPEVPTLAIGTFEAVVALATERRDLQIKAALERDVRLVHCEDGKLELVLEPGAPKTLVNELSRKLSQWTNKRWMVVVSSEQGAPTLRSQAAARQSELERGVRDDPLVRAVLAKFPGAEIVKVRKSGERADSPVDSLSPEPPPLDYHDSIPNPDLEDDGER
jgi:DNA polymerase III subunit gamma/tau